MIFSGYFGHQFKFLYHPWTIKSSFKTIDRVVGFTDLSKDLPFGSRVGRPDVKVSGEVPLQDLTKSLAGRLPTGSKFFLDKVLKRYEKLEI
jgi:hypothetical protein